jgi:glycosyltransferase involved in cell wall biosynthesis
MILIASAHFPPEPVTAATLCHDLAIALSEKRAVKVLTPRPTRPFGFSFENSLTSQEKYEHIILGSFTCPQSTLIGRMLESFSFGRHVAAYIRKNHAGIECIYVLAWPLLAQYLIVKASRKYSIPSVTHIMDIYPESMISKLPFLKKVIYNLLLPLDKSILQNTTRVITISPGMKNKLAKTRKLESDKIEIVYTWQNDAFFLNYRNAPETKSGDTPFTFMFLGSLSTTAAIEVIILAYRINGFRNARLIIAGNGAEKDRLMALSKNGDQSVIEFWDAPADKVPEIQDQADVLLLSLRKNTSHYAMPSKLPAYMFSKRPIIVCAEEESDISRSIKQAKCGWVVQPEDQHALARAMMAATASKRQDLRKYGENGYHYARQHFSKEKNLSKLASIILETAG